MENETISPSQEQMAQLSDPGRTVIDRHIRNLFRNDELEEESNVQKLHVAGADWPTPFSSLDKNSRDRHILMKIGQIVKPGKLQPLRIP